VFAQAVLFFWCFLSTVFFFFFFSLFFFELSFLSCFPDARPLVRVFFFFSTTPPHPHTKKNPQGARTPGSYERLYISRSLAQEGGNRPQEKGKNTKYAAPPRDLPRPSSLLLFFCCCCCCYFHFFLGAAAAAGLPLSFLSSTKAFFCASVRPSLGLST